MDTKEKLEGARKGGKFLKFENFHFFSSIVI